MDYGLHWRIVACEFLNYLAFDVPYLCLSVAGKRAGSQEIRIPLTEGLARHRGIPHLTGPLQDLGGMAHLTIQQQRRPPESGLGSCLACLYEVFQVR